MLKFFLLAGLAVLPISEGLAAEQYAFICGEASDVRIKVLENGDLFYQEMVVMRDDAKLGEDKNEQNPNLKEPYITWAGTFYRRLANLSKDGFMPAHAKTIIYEGVGNAYGQENIVIVNTEKKRVLVLRYYDLKEVLTLDCR